MTTNIFFAEVSIKTTLAEKTIFEKAFLLHEPFSVSNKVEEVCRCSRHIYNLHMMMLKGFAEKTITNNELWQTIHDHRFMLTYMHGVDYSIDFQSNIQLILPKELLVDWKTDYKDMTTAVINGEKPLFAEFLYSMNWLEMLFKKTNNVKL